MLIFVPDVFAQALSAMFTRIYATTSTCRVHEPRSVIAQNILKKRFREKIFFHAGSQAVSSAEMS